jgi:hypothetical protein
MDIPDDMKILIENLNIIQSFDSKGFDLLHDLVGDDSGKAVVSWFKAFAKVASTRREMMKTNLRNVASSVVDKLRKIVEPFTAESDKDTATLVKKKVEEACTQVKDWENAIKKCDFTENDVPEVFECINLRSKAQNMSVLWGMTTLKDVKVINDPEKGAELRARLKQVVESHCIDEKGNKKDFVPESLFAECSTILKIKAPVAAAKPPPKRARTS